MLEFLITNERIFSEGIEGLKDRYDLDKNNYYRILNMSVYDTPDGIVTQHTRGEKYRPKDKHELKRLPRHKREIAHKNLLTGQYVDKMYDEFANSREGKEFFEYQRLYGNGKRTPGELEDIIVVNKGEGLVAATVPSATRSNIIINADYIDKYCRNMSAKTGLSYDTIFKLQILTHELSHDTIQTESELQMPTQAVEFDNDSKMIGFYMYLADKYPKDHDNYTRIAESFTLRYSGKERKVMDNYIAEHKHFKHSDLEEKIKNDQYRKAA